MAAVELCRCGGCVALWIWPRAIRRGIKPVVEVAESDAFSGKIGDREI